MANTLRSKVNFHPLFEPFTFDSSSLQVYTPSDQVLKKIVRKNWKIRGGMIDKTVSMLVTPRVQVR